MRFRLRLKILLDVRVGEAAPGEVNAQMGRGNRAEWKQGADRLEDDRVFGRFKTIRLDGMQQLQALCSGNRFVTQLAENLQLVVRFASVAQA
ncbi:MAG TPA: hypothetical protein VNZ63_13990 [Verrucomicrobiae bacterium]|nr:hypothetical protein [Verrucomicrobiae bacterium]